MISVEDKISNTIKYRKKGQSFFSSDFVSKGSLPSVNKALSQLTKRGEIVRLAPGIYCRPEMDEVFGLGVIYPGLDEIAEAILFFLCFEQLPGFSTPFFFGGGLIEPKVVFGSQIGRTDIFGVSCVTSTLFKQDYKVAPKTIILNLIAVACCNFVRVPAEPSGFITTSY